MNGYRQSRAGMGQILRSQEMRSCVRESADVAQALYREIVAKRTGRLAASARVETVIGGARADRWVGSLLVEAPYAASHEFGTKQSDIAALDLNRVLNLMSAL